MREYLEKIKCSQLFCRSYYRKMAIASIVIMLGGIGLIFAAAYQIINIPSPPYYATTSDGRVIRLDYQSESKFDFSNYDNL